MAAVYLIIALGASIVGAISGIGGGVIIKPVLDSLSPFNVSVISFLSGVTVLSMTSVSLVRSRSLGIRLDKSRSRFLALGGVTGGLLGKYLFDISTAGLSDGNSVSAAQSMILAVLTVGVLIYTIFKPRIQTINMKGSIPEVLTGLLLGSIASFLGIGGGPINLAILAFFFSMNSKQAALSSIYIIFFSQLTSLLFTLVRGNVPPFEPLILILMIIGGIFGGFLGSAFSRKMTHREIDKLFILVLILIFFISLYNFFNFI